MSDILRMLELFEMNHEFGPAAQRDLEEIIAAVRAANAPAAQPVADDVVRDAERGKWMLKNAAWHRYEECTYMAIPLKRGADLSCYAFRAAAIDEAMLAAKQQKGDK